VGRKVENRLGYDLNFDFFFAKSNCGDFLPKFLAKFRFMGKIKIFEQNLYFLQIFELWPKFECLANLDF